MERIKHPLGKNGSDWFVLTNPEEIGPKFKGKTICAAVVYIAGQSSVTIIEY